LEDLGEQCLRFDPSLALLVDQAVPLIQYAWKDRYPGEPEDPSREEAEAALAVALALCEDIVTRLPLKVCL
jgi:hypothetical protein